MTHLTDHIGRRSCSGSQLLGDWRGRPEEMAKFPGRESGGTDETERIFWGSLMMSLDQISVISSKLHSAVSN